MRYINVSGINSDKNILISDCDFETFSKFKWYLVSGYPQRTINGKGVKLHRLISMAKTGQIVDHIDRNKLNNQRENLRIVGVHESIHNRIAGRIKRKRIYTGVEEVRGGYRAMIQRNERIWSDTYTTSIAAAIRYNQLLEENNLEGVPNSISLTMQQQMEVLKRDLLVNKKADFDSGISGISYNKTLKTWIIRKTINGRRTQLASRKNLEEAKSFLHQIQC